MLALTSQWRRLRHIYSMIANLEKEGIDPNVTTQNLLVDIRDAIDKLIKRARITDG